MNNLLALFTNNLLPILITAGVGFLAGKFLKIDASAISRITFYILSPCLVFILLTTSELSGDAILQMMGYAVIITLLTGLLIFLICLILKLDRQTTIAIVLTGTFTNAGNFGLSLNKFAFGEETLAYASVYFVTSAIMMYTLGLTIASMGKNSLKDTAISLIKLPAIYGVLLAFVVNITHFQLPEFASRPINLLADAAIPMMLILLGIQLQKVDLKNGVKPLILATILRLAAAPILALLLAGLFQLAGPARQAGVVEASMPTAVMSIVVATEFDVKPSLVTSIVTTTTILSPLTLTPLIRLLGA